MLGRENSYPTFDRWLSHLNLNLPLCWQGAAQHSAALERHQQRLRDIHAAFEAAVSAEWAEVQKTGKRQAAFLKVRSPSLYFLRIPMVSDDPSSVSCPLRWAAKWGNHITCKASVPLEVAADAKPMTHVTLHEGQMACA